MEIELVGTGRFDGHDFAWRCRPLALFIAAHPLRGCVRVALLAIGSSSLTAGDRFSHGN
jgi:hypothetical protein